MLIGIVPLLLGRQEGNEQAPSAISQSLVNEGIGNEKLAVLSGFENAYAPCH